MVWAHLLWLGAASTFDAISWVHAIFFKLLVIFSAYILSTASPFLIVSQWFNPLKPVCLCYKKKRNQKHLLLNI
jgi:hypothetical protein